MAESQYFADSPSANQFVVHKCIKEPNIVIPVVFPLVLNWQQMVYEVSSNCWHLPIEQSFLEGLLITDKWGDCKLQYTIVTGPDAVNPLTCSIPRRMLKRTSAILSFAFLVKDFVVAPGKALVVVCCTILQILSLRSVHSVDSLITECASVIVIRSLRTCSIFLGSSSLPSHGKVVVLLNTLTMFCRSVLTC